MFRNRAEAAQLLARQFEGRELRDPLVLAIPRGGVVTGAVLARELGAELDVVLSRRLRAPEKPELAVGAIGEDGHIYSNPSHEAVLGRAGGDLAMECANRLEEIARQRMLVRAFRPQAPIEGRSVIVTDDGIATGDTMTAALQEARAKNPGELLVAVPVASPVRLLDIRQRCDALICLLAPPNFWAIGQFYADFSPVEGSEWLDLLRATAPAQQTA
jgi:predicted phosphoribosyltransferase